MQEKLLHGNSFRIALRNLTATEAEKLSEHLKDQPFQLLLNYYDNQRFGMPGGPYNTHQIGAAIVQGDWHKALRHFKMTNNFTHLSREQRKIKEPKELFKNINPKKIAFFVSAYNSFLWNRSVSKSLSKQRGAKEFMFKNVGKLNLVAESASIPAAHEISGYEFSAAEFSVQPKLVSRNFSVTTPVYCGDIENDELHPGRKKVILSFFLPPGSYATMFVKQIFLRIK